MAFKYQFETILNLKIRMEDMKNAELKLAIENNAPLDLIYSCYKGREFQCGECESCIRLRNALNSVDISTKKKLVLKYFKEE